MADDDKQPTLNLASAGVILVSLVSLVVMGVYFFPRESQQQKVDERLWEDPFAVIEDSLRKLPKDDLAKQCSAKPSSDVGLSVCYSPLHPSDSDTLVIGVAMPSIAYTGDVERQIRIRYAVMAALERKGFAPIDSRHIGYFLWTQRDERPSFVLFERFEQTPSQDNASSKRILVLWLTEEILQGVPLRKLSELKQFLFNSCDKNNFQEFSFIGPFSSYILLAMTLEVQRYGKEISNRYNRYNSRIYTYGASVPDQFLLGESSGKSLQSYFERVGIRFERTVSTDDILARGIVRELELRSVTPGRVGPGQPGGGIALISESDTVYGHALLQSVEREFTNAAHSDCRDDTCPWIRKLSYRRGLDGQIPLAEAPERKSEDQKVTQTEKQTSKPDFFNIVAESKGYDRQLRQGQIDYLRQLNTKLHQIDADLRNGKPSSSIKAIGLLGSDVIDKLLILRALKPEFPEALFFTNDFDEAYTMQGELPWTRNLIISSSFGPSLSPQYQGAFLPFRNSYQTSAFLATQLAIDDTLNDRTSFKAQLATELTSPRIFEIERNGEMLSFEGARPTPKNIASDQIDCLQNPERCNPGNIPAYGPAEYLADVVQPKIEELIPPYAVSSQIALERGLAGLAGFVLALLCSRKVRNKVGVELGIVFTLLVACALTAYYWNRVANFLTEDGKGEPIALLQGVSVWPTVLLRILGIILSLYLIWRVKHSLHNNLMTISAVMRLPVFPKKRTLWRNITSIFDFSLGDDQVDQSLRLNVQVPWQAYVCQEHFWRRSVRAYLFVSTMFQIGVVVLNPIIGPATLPSRGILAHKVYFFTTLFDVFSMQFLNFFVLDATLFCLIFVNKLRYSRTQWPIETTDLFKGRLGLQTDFVQEYINLEFIAQRTRCIGAVIYYPFFLMALLVASLSTAFASYAWHPEILIMQGISLSFVLGFAITLWRAAEAARKTARKNLKSLIAGIVSAQDKPGKDEQLKVLLNTIDQMREGAFSHVSEQPLVRAVFLPLISAIGAPVLTDLVEHLIKNGIFPGL
jgi:hypothetical protein